jgi:flagellar motor switch protein FliM
MEANDPSNLPAEVLSQSEVERLLMQVAEQESGATVVKADGEKQIQAKDAIQPYDFRHPVFLSPTELRKLRVHHDEFINSLAARLSIYLRVEFGLQMSKLQTLTYQKFLETINSPAHITLFKVEPLRGICILDVNPRLALTIVDRLLGGPGHSVNANRHLSEIEVALLDEAVNVIVNEWCNHWSAVQELRPTLLGHENSSQFLQTSPRDTIMLVLSMEARMGDCMEQIQIGFPYPTLEPLLRLVSAKLDDNHDKPAAPTKPRWTPELNTVPIPITAEWFGTELTVKELSELKPGDLVPLAPDFPTRIRLRLAATPKFVCTLGTQENHWAVQIQKVIQSDTTL